MFATSAPQMLSCSHLCTEVYTEAKFLNYFRYRVRTWVALSAFTVTRWLLLRHLHRFPTGRETGGPLRPPLYPPGVGSHLAHLAREQRLRLRERHERGRAPAAPLARGRGSSRRRGPRRGLCRAHRPEEEEEEESQEKHDRRKSMPADNVARLGSCL